MFLYSHYKKIPCYWALKNLAFLTPIFFTGDPSKLSLKIFTKQNQRSNLFFDRHPNFLNECVFQIKRFPHYLLSWQTFFSWLLFKVGFICFLRERLSSLKLQMSKRIFLSMIFSRKIEDDRRVFQKFLNSFEVRGHLEEKWGQIRKVKYTVNFEVVEASVFKPILIDLLEVLKKYIIYKWVEVNCATEVSLS